MGDRRKYALLSAGVVAAGVAIAFHGLRDAAGAAATGPVLQAATTRPMPEASFFQHCAFVCVDVQPGAKHRMAAEQMPTGWRKQCFSVEDVNAAIAYTYDVAHPNARRVADACRKLNLPMIFVHWGYRFADGMDLDPETRTTFLQDFGTDYARWPHHISRPDSRPADILGVRQGEYVIAKTAQDAFPSSNLEYVLRNLAIRNIVFVGGHTGGCLGRTAASARRLGYKMLCVQDATFDARQSARVPNLLKTGYDYLLTTEEFSTWVNAIAGR